MNSLFLKKERVKKMNLKPNETVIVPGKYKMLSGESFPDCCANCKFFGMSFGLTSACGGSNFKADYYVWNGWCPQHKRRDE